MRPKRFTDPVKVIFTVEREFYKQIQDLGNNHGNISDLIRKALEREIFINSENNIVKNLDNPDNSVNFAGN